MPTPLTAGAQTKPLLRAVPYFKQLNDDALDTIVRELIVRRYNSGEIIFLEGEANAGLHLVIKGCCKVYRLSEQGREHILATLGPEDSFNEVPVVDGKPNPANAISCDDTTLWVISTESLSRLRRLYPILNDIIIQNLAMRCRQLVQRVYNLSFLSVTGRLASFLLQQSDKRNKLNRYDWTHEEIAAHLGTVVRALPRPETKTPGAVHSS